MVLCKVVGNSRIDLLFDKRLQAVMFVSIICFSCLRALRSLKSRYKTMLIKAKLSAIERIDTVTSVILQSNHFLCKGLEHEGKIVTYTISAFSP